MKEPLDAVGTHRYSDLGFYALARIFKKLTQTSLDEWVQNNIYERMGWASMGYLPISTTTTIGQAARDGRFTLDIPGCSLLVDFLSWNPMCGIIVQLELCMYVIVMPGLPNVLIRVQRKVYY